MSSIAHKQTRAKYGSVIGAIERFLNRTPKGEIVSRQSLLSCGTTDGVDSAIRDLRDEGILTKVAAGLYVNDMDANNVPSFQQVVEAKAKAFGRRLFQPGDAAAEELGLAEPGSSSANEFLTTGRSSSFIVWLGNVRVKFKSVSPKKVKFGDSTIGKTVRALWSFTIDGISDEKIRQAMEQLSGTDKQTFKHSAHAMPWWLWNRVKNFHASEYPPLSAMSSSAVLGSRTVESLAKKTAGGIKRTGKPVAAQRAVRRSGQLNSVQTAQTMQDKQMVTTQPQGASQSEVALRHCPNHNFVIVAAGRACFARIDLFKSVRQVVSNWLSFSETRKCLIC